MDLQYLLWLQDIRFALGSGLENFFIFICKGRVLGIFAFIPVIMYWVFDKKTGMKISMTFCIGNYLNGLLKIIFCCYRPWIRDERIKPPEKAKLDATGYSFPSGHSTMGVCLFGYSGWLARKMYRSITLLCWLYCGLLLFSRNYLGVHTPQDVMVGALLGLVAIWLSDRIFRWAETYDGADRIVLLVGLALVFATLAFIQLKPYPMNYVDGQLLVDPVSMKGDSFMSTGALAGILPGWYMERKYLNFGPARSRKEGLVRLLIGLAVLLAALGLALLLKFLVPVKCITDTFLGAVIFFSGTYIAPRLFLVYSRHEMKKEIASSNS